MNSSNKRFVLQQYRKNFKDSSAPKELLFGRIQIHSAFPYPKEVGKDLSCSSLHDLLQFWFYSDKATKLNR